jgi:hypothetical protein
MRTRFLVFLLAVAAAAATLPGCAGGLFGRDYEYQEDTYVALDGHATVYVNASLPALVALRGVDLPTDRSAPFDRAAVQRVFASPVARVGSISAFRRHGRRFVSVRLDVDDIRQLGRAPMFAWATYGLERVGGQIVYKQTVGPAAGRRVDNAGWTGAERVAFKLHLPAKIEWHPKEVPVQRGNILEWEQPFKDRLAGVPLAMEVRMQPETILYRTLWLFGVSVLLALAALAGVVWWIVRR